MKRTALFLFTFLATVSSPAALVVYEGFDYAPGADALNGQTGGEGFTTAWTASNGSPDIVAGTMTYTDSAGLTLQTTGNRGFFDATNPTVGAGTNSISFRDINFSGLTDTTLYFSLLGQKVAGDARGMNVAFFSGASETIAIGYGSNVPPGGPYTWGIFVGSVGTNGGYSTVPVLDPTFVVMRIDLNVDGINERVRLYVNPTLGMEPDAADVDFSNRDVLSTFSALTRVRPFTGGSTAAFIATQAEFDEIRIGQTYADVTPVPEPASGILAAATGLLLLGRRSRRQGL